MNAHVIAASLLDRNGTQPQVSLMFEPVEAGRLADDLERVAGLLDDKGRHDDADKATVARLDMLAQVLRHQLSHLVTAASAAGPAPNPLQEAAGTFKDIPVEHVEWALKVYRLTASHERASSNATLERVFEKGEAQAKSFFVQTQNVWNMRVRGGEAAAFEVVLGVQDARKHKKKGSFRGVDRVLCTG